jgi:hypothetical protein
MATINNPQYTSIHAMLHLLQFALVLLGTIYLFVLMIEGWYYNLYLAYLVDCEKRIMSGRHLTTVALFDRKAVKSIHPSYFFILMLVVFANLTHLFQASYDQWRNVPAPMISCAVYACVFLPVALGGRVPKWIDRTLAGPE